VYTYSRKTVPFARQYIIIPLTYSRPVR